MNSLQTYFPFSPPIGHAELPKELVNDLNKGCDDIVNDKELSKSEDFSHQLVGQVKQELKIPKDIINKWSKWFGTQVRIYAAGYFNQTYIPEQNIQTTPKEQILQEINLMKIDVISAWYVRSFAGDYNPIHTHPNSDLTCVGFLKVPDLSKERKNLAQSSGESFGDFHSNKIGDGSQNSVLEVLSNNGPNGSFYENDNIGFFPKVGNWYLFPANLRHLVYPFESDGERRSFSINMNTKHNNS